MMYFNNFRYFQVNIFNRSKVVKCRQYNTFDMIALISKNPDLSIWGKQTSDIT